MVPINSIDVDPTTRHTVIDEISRLFGILTIVFYKVWSLVIGGFFYFVSAYGTDQAMVQRFISMSTLEKAQM